jgi:type III secretion protein T
MDAPFDLKSLTDLAGHWLLAMLVAMARPAMMLSVHALFTRLQLGAIVRGAVAAVLALPLLPRIGALLPIQGGGDLTLLLLVGKEAILGAVIGIPLSVPFWALDVAGDILDQQRGATQGRLNDPAGFEDVSISGTLLLMTGVGLFVVTGGLTTLASLLYASWAVWPPLSAMPAPVPQTPALILGLLDAVLNQGLLLATPVLLAMLLADATMIMIGRFAPQLRIDDMATAARNLVFFVFLPLYCGYLVVYVRQDQAGLPRAIELIQKALPASAP